MEVPDNNDTKQQQTITCLTQTHIVTCLTNTVYYNGKKQLSFSVVTW